MTDEKTSPTLALWTAILGRCFIFSIVLMVLWLVIMMTIGEWACNLHARLFGIDAADVRLVYYQFMGGFKIAAITFFLLPYLALKCIQGKGACCSGADKS